MIDIKIGDCRKLIHELDNESIDCVMTSPPYWGLRDYGHTDQIGLEATPEEYLKTMLGFFDDVKLKLKAEGNCFVNLGDSYMGSGQDSGKQNRELSQNIGNRLVGEASPTKPPSAKKHGTLKPKSLCMVPQRFAWGMIEHGWILRNEIIWAKPNHMPESVTDRLTKAHEVIYHFVKQQKYYYNLDAIREPIKENTSKRYERGWNGNGERCYPKGVQNHFKAFFDKDTKPTLKNPGDVWSITTQPYPESHFAVFPLELVRRPILAGCPIGGTVLDPFGGSGTVGEFCRHNDRNAILFELNPEYVKLIKERSMADIPELDRFV